MIAHACSHGSPISSRKTRISSATVSAGWVSLSWKATLSAKTSQRSPQRARNRRTTSATEQATRKYSCVSRSSRPASASSEG